MTNSAFQLTGPGHFGFGMFQFTPPKKLSKPARHNHYRAIQDRLDERLAASVNGELHYHIERKSEDGQVLHLVRLKDTREVPYPAHFATALATARAWVETGEGAMPHLPTD